jgi:hypothetical protein
MTIALYPPHLLALHVPHDADQAQQLEQAEEDEDTDHAAATVSPDQVSGDGADKVQHEPLLDVVLRDLPRLGLEDAVLLVVPYDPRNAQRRSVSPTDIVASGLYGGPAAHSCGVMCQWLRIGEGRAGLDPPVTKLSSTSAKKIKSMKMPQARMPVDSGTPNAILLQSGRQAGRQAGRYAAR